MFITKKHISRRAVLRGAGVAIALPLLDAMIPASTALAATAAAPKPKLGFIYFPHGAIMNRWKPEAAVSPLGGKDRPSHEPVKTSTPHRATLRSAPKTDALHKTRRADLYFW